MKTRNFVKILKNTALVTTLGLFGLSTLPASAAAQAVDLDRLMQLVRQGQSTDRADNEKRMQQFRSNRAQQATMLREIETKKSAAERVSANNNSIFEANDREIITLDKQLDDRLGDLKELFGVLQQAAGDTKANFDSSLTAVQFPERDAYMADILTKLGQTSKFASMEEIERLWAEMLV